MVLIPNHTIFEDEHMVTENIHIKHVTLAKG